MGAKSYAESIGHVLHTNGLTETEIERTERPESMVQELNDLLSEEGKKKWILQTFHPMELWTVPHIYMGK